MEATFEEYAQACARPDLYALTEKDEEMLIKRKQKIEDMWYNEGEDVSKKASRWTIELERLQESKINQQQQGLSSLVESITVLIDPENEFITDSEVKSDAEHLKQQAVDESGRVARILTSRVEEYEAAISQSITFLAHAQAQLDEWKLQLSSKSAKKFSSAMMPPPPAPSGHSRAGSTSGSNSRSRSGRHHKPSRSLGKRAQWQFFTPTFSDRQLAIYGDSIPPF